MGVTNVGKVQDNDLGLYLKIVSQNGTYSQLADQSVAWKNILKKKKGAAEGRERRFNLRSSYGMAAAQFLAVNGQVMYPDAHKATLSEGVAYYKDFAVTIEVERTLIAKAISDMGRYGEPLAEEMKCKTVGLARVLSAAVYQDGTGVIGTVLSSAVTSGKLVVVLDPASTARGHVGWCEYGDKHKFATTAGVAQVATAGSYSYLAVTDVNRATDTVTYTAYDATGAAVAVTAVNQIGAGDLIYRMGTTPNDVSGIVAATEYGLLSEAFVGIPSLTANDGRTVHGITMSGAIKGQIVDANAQPIDSQHFQQLMSQIKTAVGENAYSWKDAIMAPETLDALVESRETDRRFTSVQDNKRGVASLGYLHGKTTLTFLTDEYCPKKKIYVLPEADVLQFYGSDFDWVKPEGGNKFFLKPGSGGHYRTVRAYMEGSGLILNVHPQSCGTLTNFTA